MKHAAKRQATLELIRETLNRHGSMRLRASGFSMAPSIRSADWLHVVPARPHQVRPGDIVLYERRDTLVAHRILKRQRRDNQLRFLLKGDAHFTADPPVAARALVARVVAVARDGRCRRLDTLSARLTARLLLLSSTIAWLVFTALRPLVRRLPASRARCAADSAAHRGQTMLIAALNRRLSFRQRHPRA